ncbi:hypothetical protein J7K18_01585 [bacterium]|nr:hypothetical protein [bacterium]
MLFPEVALTGLVNNDDPSHNLPFGTFAFLICGDLFNPSVKRGFREKECHSTGWSLPGEPA